MTSRERVLAAAERKPSDRIPVELGGTMNAGISRIAHKRLLAHLGLEPGPEIDDVVVFGSVVPDPRLLDRFGVDFIPIQLRSTQAARSVCATEDGTITDEFGRVWKRTALYYDIVDHPIKEPTIDAINRVSWPDPDDNSLVEGLREEVAALRKKSDRAIVARCFSGGVSDIAYSLRGMDSFLVDVFVNEKFATAFLNRIEDFFIAKVSLYMDAVGAFVDIFEYGNDYGTQRGLTISPDLYRRLFQPREKRIFEAVKTRSRAKIFFHCCGGIFDIIGDMIDAGMDILNPLQPNAAGMEPERLVSEYGKDVSFCGGIDVQHLLPYGTPQEVRDATRRVASIFNRYNGYILAASHNIQADVPPENVVAMFTALDEV